MDFDEDPEYLDLDDILAQTQTVNCRFLLNIPGLEFLSPSNSEGATQGSQTLLPFWMAKTLFTYSMIDIDTPKQYSNNFREIIQAEPEEVDLRKAGPYYYKFGQLLMGLVRERGNNLAMYTNEGQRNKFRREEGEVLEDRRSLASSLLQSFHVRRHRLLQFSNNGHRQNERHKNVKKFELLLDNMEMSLFRIGCQQTERLKEWNTRQIECISNSVISIRLSKRQKLEDSHATAK